MLQWLHGADKKQPVFVANRVAEILDSSTIDQWRHVEGTLNPADIGTRGKSVHELEKSEWFTGPAWLREKEDACPQTSPQLFQQKTEDIEQVFEVVSEEKDIDWEKFGSFRRMTRIFAYCLRFGSKIKGKVVKPEEMRQVIRLLLKKSQMESFGQTYQALAAGKPMAASDYLSKLSPFMDDQNLMRLTGRLRHADASYEMKHPILLSAKHPIVRKLIEDAHESNYHEGTEYVRSILQQNYWIIGLRNALRNVKLKCVKCRKQQAGGVQPFMADLPKERLEQRVFPFANTGVDYFEPFEVKFMRKSMKRWCCLFTCLTTRAVYIEVVPSLEADACLAAITRFIARRGKPNIVLSDNGTNFVGAAREMREWIEAWNQSDIEQHLAQKQIK